jgi:hypothetical protein
MYGLPAPLTTPTQMFGSPQPLYASAPAGMQQQQQHPHQQTRPAYPPFRAPSNAYVAFFFHSFPYCVLLCFVISLVFIVIDY